MKQRWSCYNQSPSGRLFGVEPDYLLDLEVLFQSGVYSRRIVHPSMEGGLDPLVGVWGLASP